MSLFKGAATALITPMREDKVDYDSLEKLVNIQLKGNIDALIVNGTTGEPTTLTHSERTKIAKTVIDIVDKRIPVILGAGSNNTYTAIEYAQENESLGADGVLTVTPYYNKEIIQGTNLFSQIFCTLISVAQLLKRSGDCTSGII